MDVLVGRAGGSHLFHQAISATDEMLFDPCGKPVTPRWLLEIDGYRHAHRVRSLEKDASMQYLVVERDGRNKDVRGTVSPEPANFPDHAGHHQVVGNDGQGETTRQSPDPSPLERSVIPVQAASKLRMEQWVICEDVQGIDGPNIPMWMSPDQGIPQRKGYGAVSSAAVEINDPYSLGFSVERPRNLAFVFTHANTTVVIR
jgi:hypothetical protein